MKIFYSNLNGLPPYSLSGAEITIDEFLKVFSEHGHEVLCVNCDEKWNFYQKKYNKIYDNSYFLIEETNTKKYFFHSAECFKSNLKIMLEKFKPDFIFSQLNYLEELSRYCEEYKECKIVYFMHSNLAVGKNSNSQLDILLSNKVLKIICVSKYILNNLPIELQKKSEVIYPIINENNYISEIKNKKYIVFFNPISIKGINIVISLSKIFRNEKFIIYETWGHISESYKTIIKENENIEIRNKTNNFKEIF
nr:glycosyltransferase [uncultured Dubosiella sp.]